MAGNDDYHLGLVHGGDGSNCSSPIGISALSIILWGMRATASVYVWCYCGQQF